MTNSSDLTHWVDEIESTNTAIMQRLAEEVLPNGYCLATRFQTSGRGQAGNSWESCRGENLLFSLVLHSGKFPLQRQFLLSKVVSVAIIRWLSSRGVEAKIKYPNDIFVGDKKLAGILIENIIAGGKMKYSVVGIGLNVNQREFVENSATAISMSMISGQGYDLESELQVLVSEILSSVEHFSESTTDEFRHLYAKNLYRKEGFYRYQTPSGEEFSAEIISISDNGLLTLRTEAGEERKFYFKEVRFLI